MHELAIAQAMIEAASEAAEQEHASRILVVRVRIGALSGVDPDALRFSFEIAAEGTACAGAVLEIEALPVRVHCPNCRGSRTLTPPVRLCCPTCGTPTPEILAGRELELVNLEVDDHESARP